MEEKLPPFVSHVGQAPASFVQASFLIGGKVVTFQIPLVSIDGTVLSEARKMLMEEVAKCPR